MAKKTEQSVNGQASKAAKESRFKSLLTKAGGTEGVLEGVSKAAAKGAQLIRNQKNPGPGEPMDYEFGLRKDDKAGETLLGMPPAVAYGVIGLIAVFVLFFVFMLAKRAK